MKPAKADLYDANGLIFFGGSIGSQSFSNFSGLSDVLTTPGLGRLLPGYDSISGVFLQLNIRGIPAAVLLANESSFGAVAIPSLGITQTFNGSTREETLALIRAFLTQNDPLMDLLAQRAVRSTPNDPVAGNPFSLMSQMAAADFNRALESAFSGPGSLGLGLGFGFGQFTARGGVQQNASTLPLNWTFNLSDKDRLEVDLPISWVTTGGANSYFGSLGLLWRREMTPDWVLQGALRTGFADSNDMQTSSGLQNAGLTSTYRLTLPWRGAQMVIANQVTYASTFEVSVGGNARTYNQSNMIFRNGVAVSVPLGVEALGRNLAASLFVIGTNFAGDPVYIRNYQEWGAYLGASGASNGRAGFTILTGDRGTRGFTLRAAWNF